MVWERKKNVSRGRQEIIGYPTPLAVSLFPSSSPVSSGLDNSIIQSFICARKLGTTGELFKLVNYRAKASPVYLVGHKIREDTIFCKFFFSAGAKQLAKRYFICFLWFVVVCFSIFFVLSLTIYSSASTILFA
jgi:hypothetical protein